MADNEKKLPANEKKQNQPPPQDENSEENSEEDEEQLLNEVDRAVEQLPAPVRQFMEMGIFSGPVANPIFRKVNERHITSMIQLASKSEDHDHQNKRENKIVGVVVFLVVIGVVVFLIVWGQTHDALDQITDVVYRLIGLGLAVLGGIGIGVKWLSKDEIE